MTSSEPGQPASRADEIARALAVDAVRLVPVPAGASREAYRVETPSGEGIAFLRADPASGGGVLAGTEMSLEREEMVLTRLRALGFPVPAVLASLRDPAATLLELVPGTSRPDAGTIEQVAPEYMTWLARLHALDPDAVALPRFATTTDAIRADLRWWGDRAATTGVDQRPLVRLALRMLADTLPQDPTPAGPVHGDAGPGNFMVHEGKVSGLLDWELFHAGDHHEDLAWIWMRSAHTEFGDFTTRLAEYETATQAAVDRSRLGWHVAFVMLKSVISLWTGIKTTPRGADVLDHLIAALAYDALLGSVLVRLSGGSLRLLDTPAVPFDSASVRLVDQIITALGQTDRRTAAVVAHLRRHAELEAWRTVRLAWDLARLPGADAGEAGATAELTDRIDTADSADLGTLALIIGAAADRELRSQPRSERLVRRAQRNGLGV